MIKSRFKRTKETHGEGKGIITTLENVSNRRKFTINNENLHYLKRIIEHDLKRLETNQLILIDTCLLKSTINDIRDYLDKGLKKWDIWDLSIGNGITQPIIDPKENQFIEGLIPITKEHKWFIQSLIKFLNNSNYIKITRN